MAMKSPRMVWITLGVGALGYVIWLFAWPSKNASTLEVSGPAPGTLLAVGADFPFTGRVTGGASEIECNGRVLAVGDDGTFEGKLPGPEAEGLHVVRCAHPGVGVPRFVRSWYAHRAPPAHEGPPVVPLDGRHLVREAAVLVLPAAFFNPEWSDLPRDIQRLFDSAVTEALADMPPTEVAVVQVGSLRLCGASRLQIEPMGAGVTVRLGLERICGQTRARIAAEHLPTVDVEGSGHVRARLGLEPDGAGGVAVDLLRHTVIIDSLCVGVCANVQQVSTIQRFADRKIAPRLRQAVAEARDEINHALDKFGGRLTLLDGGQPMTWGVRVSSVDGGTGDAGDPAPLRLAWDFVASASSAAEHGAGLGLTWAGPAPSARSSRPHVLISDRLANYLLFRTWSDSLSRGVPGTWGEALAEPLDEAGYRLKELTFGGPPAIHLAPDRVRLFLQDVRLVLTDLEGQDTWELRLHADLPVRVVPNQTNTALEFTVEVSDDATIDVECREHSDARDPDSAGPCASESGRFRELVDLGRDLAGPVSARVSVPLPRPAAPEPGQVGATVSYTRVQLVQEAPGWLLVEFEVRITR